jgi:hypothetical protein
MMSSIKSFFSSLIEKGTIFKIIILTFLIYLILHSIFPPSSDQINLQNIQISDITKKVYDIFSLIPEEKENIFKKEKLEEIKRLRTFHIEGKKAFGESCLFNFDELEEACKQAFGAVSESYNAVLIRGIMTANGVFSEERTSTKKYRLYTPLAMGIESKRDINLLIRYDDKSEFSHINKEGGQYFTNEQLFELRILREKYLQKKPYITQNVTFEFEKLPKAFELAFETYSPSLQALFQRGTLTAHGEYKLTESAKKKNYKLMTPAKMGLQIRSDVNETFIANDIHHLNKYNYHK